MSGEISSPNENMAMDRICNLSTLFLFVNLIPHSPIICAYLNSLEYYSSFYFQSHYVKHNKLITHITHSQEEYIKEIFAVMITYASVFWTLYSNMFTVIWAKMCGNSIFLQNVRKYWPSQFVVAENLNIFVWGNHRWHNMKWKWCLL